MFQLYNTMNYFFQLWKDVFRLQLSTIRKRNARCVESGPGQGVGVNNVNNFVSQNSKC